MKMKKLSLLLAVLCCLLLPLQSLAAIPEAPADGQSLYVLDAANVIDSADENAMLALGAALDDASTAQVVAVTVEFLDGMSAEEYAYQLFNSWGIGSAKEENGVLLLLSVGEREYWVTLGKGIEKKLTVSKATEIVDDTALDSFAAGDYSSGMRAAYEGLCERVAEIYSVSLDTAALGAQSALNEQAALKAQQEKYIRDLQMLDADALRETIANLEADLTAKQAELTEVRAQLEEAIDRQAALNRQKTDLENRIKALEDAQKTAEPTEEPTAAPTANPTEQPENTPVPEETVSPTEAPAPDTTVAPDTADDDASILARLFGASAMAEGGAESLDELRARLTAIQAELENANADVEQLTARHAELKSTVDADEAALKEARDSLDIVNEGEAQLQSRIDAANKTIEGCSARIVELNQEIAELTEKLSHSDEIDALTAQIAELDRQILSIQDSDA